MRTRYEYKTLAIIDYPDEMLEASTNPFAVVLLVAKEALLQVNGTAEERDGVLLEQKLRIVRLLKERMEIFGERKTRAILTFMNNYVSFKKSETNLIFMNQTDQLLGKSKTMGIFEQLAEIKEQETLEKAVRAFLATTEFSPAKIAGLLDVPVLLVEKIKNELYPK